MYDTCKALYGVCLDMRLSNGSLEPMDIIHFVRYTLHWKSGTMSHQNI